MTLRIDDIPFEDALLVNLRTFKAAGHTADQVWMQSSCDHDEMFETLIGHFRQPMTCGQEAFVIEAHTLRDFTLSERPTLDEVATGHTLIMECFGDTEVEMFTAYISYVEHRTVGRALSTVREVRQRYRGKYRDAAHFGEVQFDNIESRSVQHLRESMDFESYGLEQLTDYLAIDAEDGGIFVFEN